MKLLNVKDILDQEEHIQQTDPEREVLKECNDETTNYAILSHRWDDGSEVGYEEMTGLMKMEEQKRDKVKKRYGYQKIIKSCEQARKDGYEWLWIDTCCIDKRSSSELSEAINSMYRWYQNAGVCYAYLNDVDVSVFPTKRDDSNYAGSNGWPVWFMRGWTLQELIAPKKVDFFNKNWATIGNKQRLAPVLEEITGVPRKVLRNGLAATPLCVAQIMSWAAGRETTRVEGRAYSLMGLFGVNMPMLYGKGKKAFERLQLEIIRVRSDQSIFAWYPQKPRTGSVLAEDPSEFKLCGDSKMVKPDEFLGMIEVGRPWYFKFPNRRMIQANPILWCRAAWLRTRARSLSQQLYTFSVNSAGIQVCLPVIPSRDSPSHFRAILACTTNEWALTTIDLVFSGSSYDRTFGIEDTLKTYPEFKTLYLTHHQDANEARREFKLDDKHALYHGFTRQSIYPREFRGDTATLSSHTDDLIVVVYANDGATSRFAVGLGCYRGQGWMHVVYDDCPATQEDFGKRAYDRMWSVRAEHVQGMPKQKPYWVRHPLFVKHAHLPRSIWAARIICSTWEEKDNYNVVVDVEECSGCCDGPRQWSTTFIGRSGLDMDMPGLMDTDYHSYRLQLDGWEAWFDRCSGQRIALGDYGDYSDGTLTRTGNIFEDMRTLGIKPMNSVCCPVVSRISSVGWSTRHVKNWEGLVVENDFRKPLVLCDPKGLSLPANDDFVLLLKALSTRAAGKRLVISVIQCSDFYRVDDEERIDDGQRRRSGDDSASDSGNHSAVSRVLTPLYAVARPQVWKREPPCWHRKQRFETIREHFYALVNRCHNSVNRQKKDEAIKFFSDMFGLQLLRNYVGKITFFERLPWIMETDSPSEVIVSSTEEHGLLAHLFQGRRQSNAAQGPRLEVVLPLLRKRCKTLRAEDGALHRGGNEKQKVEPVLESVSQTLSASLLHHVEATLCDVYLEQEHLRTGQANRNVYESQLNTPFMVQEIRVLQAKLDAAGDDDEQRALGEDVTGKILWLCWCGICAEVNRLLPKVVDYIRTEGNMTDLEQTCDIETSVTYLEPDDDQAHLQRIMFDARAGVSKHQLLLDARAAEQAKWSGATISRDTNHTDTQVPHTSSQTPSTSVV